MEKRIYKRLELPLYASFAVNESSAKDIETMVVNIGPEGLCFLSKIPLDIGRAVTLTVCLDSEKKVRLNSVVKWAEKAEQGNYKIGVEIKETATNDEITFVQFYCDQLLSRVVKRKKILVVDDEEDMVSLLQIELESKNFDVIVAGDGQEGYEKYSSEHPDLIILDLMMPKMNGLGVCRKIRWERQDLQTPILMLTGKVEDTDRIIGRVVGAEKYITKPFEIKDLMQGIDELLKQKNKS